MFVAWGLLTDSDFHSKKNEYSSHRIVNISLHG